MSTNTRPWRRPFFSLPLGFFATLLFTMVIVSRCGLGLRGTGCSSSTTWRTIDDWTTPSGIGNVAIIAHGMVVTPQNTVFTAAYHNRGTGPQKKWIVRRGTGGGSQWATVDEFTYSTSVAGAEAYNVWTDSLGRIIAQGAGFDASDVSRWVTRLSSDKGDSWSTLDDYAYVNGYEAFAAFNQTGPAVDRNGAWYIVGTGSDATARHWLVRKSTDQGASWSVVLDYQYAPGQPSSPRTIYVDSNQDLYAGGQAADASGVGHWVVLRSSDFGASWAVVDDFQLAPSQTAQVKGLIVLEGRILLVTGGAADAGGVNRWVTRRSSDRGATWETVDLISSTASNAQTEILEDAQRYLYIGGYIGLSPNRNPTLRRSNDRGVTWSTVDELTGDSYALSAMRAVARGPDNALYTVSQTVEAGGRNHTIVRKRDCW